LVRKSGVIVMRQCGKVLVCIFFLVGSLHAAEYKNATFKGLRKYQSYRGVMLFDVNGQEVYVNVGSFSWKAFDKDGKELTGTSFARPLVPGNVVDIVTAPGRNMEMLKEIRLVKGELAEPGQKLPMDSSEPKSKHKRGGQDKDKTTYKAATIKSVDKKNVVLEVDGKEITVVTGNRMKFVDADGKQLKGKGQSKRILKEGTQIDVTTSKSEDGTETIREVHLVRASADDK
jgi:hypothetical protein